MNSESDKDAFNRWWRQWREQQRTFHLEIQMQNSATFSSMLASTHLERLILDSAALVAYLRIRYPEMSEEELRLNAALFDAEKQRNEWLLTEADTSRWN